MAARWKRGGGFSASPHSIIECGEKKNVLNTKVYTKVTVILPQSYLFNVYHIFRKILPQLGPSLKVTVYPTVTCDRTIFRI